MRLPWYEETASLALAVTSPWQGMQPEGLHTLQKNVIARSRAAATKQSPASMYPHPPLRKQIQPPDVEGHGVTLGVFELEFSQEGEAQLAADGIRGQVGGRGAGVQECMPLLQARPLNDDPCSHGGDAMALVFGHHHPAGLID